MDRSTAIRFYNYFWNKSCDSQPPSMKAQDLSVIDSFIEIGVAKSETQLFSYLCYQFQYWRSLDTKFGKGRVMPNWVFGAKAISRFENAYPSSISSAYEQLRKSIFIDRDYLVKKTSGAPVEILRSDFVSEADEFTRSRFYGTPEGLILCLDYTSMYHGGSAYCPSCPNKIDCIEMMKSVSTNLYEARIH